MSGLTEGNPVDWPLRELFDGSRDGVFVSDPRGFYTYVNPAGAALLGYGRDELLGRSVVEVIHADEIPRVEAWRTSQPANPRRGDWRLKRRDDSWIDVEISAHVLADGRWFGMVRDVSERRESEERLKLLAREVDHRANNLLAVVQGAISLSTAETPAALKEVLLGRVSALARAHQLLAGGRWTGADLRRLVEEELRAFASAGDARVSIEGEAFALSPATAQGVAMAMHELATNAVKHGALSTLEGRVAVSWTQVTDISPAVITWREMGGPRVREPARRGLGMSVLERALWGAAGGRTQLIWAPDGLVCELWLGRPPVTMQ
ncbi:HWE histidine kinase domain-containing protein [Phenylobacterium sp.]|uniref:HWE histidine kinase domain-containing protein n=1 Tax=Phenylobacterium sp. TaxID=1871053 RepID=UPI002F3FC703